MQPPATTELEMLAENLEAVVWIAAPEFDEIVYVNPAYENVWGRKRESLYEDPLSFLEAVHPDDRDRVETALAEFPEQEFAEEFRIVRPDDDVRWVADRAIPVHDDDGAVVRIVGIARDITERRETEAELRERETMFRQLAEHLDQIVWMTTADMREVLYVNPVFEEAWGIDRDRLYENAEALVEAVHPQDREMVLGEFDKLITDDYEVEYRIVRPDGEVRWIHDRATPVFDGEGNVYRIVGDASDITDRIEREQELERALDLLERTERIAEVGGWEIDVDTMEVFWTDHLFDILDVPYDEEPPLDEALDVYHEGDRPIVEGAVETAIDAGDSFDVEARFRTSSGEVRWLRIQGAPEIVDDEVVSLRGAAQDVTERKKRERRLEELVRRLGESNERLEQFAYAASHDLQEPLRMVSSYLQLIERRYGDALDAEGEEFLEFAVDGADRMREMVDGLLKYSRVDAGGDEFEPVDLETALDEVLESLEVRTQESGAEIVAESLPRVEGDAGQLRQVFQNLIDNAIEYSGDERPRVHIAADRNGPEWTISVSDEGIGLDPEDQERIFEVFQRANSREEHSGAGIGLALCERIIERHKGSIWVDSEPGEGATFSFTLPAAEERAGE